MLQKLSISIKFKILATVILVFGISLAGLKVNSKTTKYPGEVLALPGELNKISVFNSNCPEVVLGEGILLSTLSPDGMKYPSAHLNYSFNGEFDAFLHHIADGKKSGHMEDLVLGLIAKNSSQTPVNLKTLKAASYLSQPDAPFKKLPKISDNTTGDIFAGPGDRVCQNIVLGKIQPGWKTNTVIPLGKLVLVKTLRIPVSNLIPPLNGRNMLVKFQSDGPVELAAVSMFAKKTKNGNFEIPNAREFFNQLINGNLVKPRGLKPSKPGTSEPFRYGRVAGVSVGSSWHSEAEVPFSISKTPYVLSFPISSLKNGTFGTRQNQSGKIIRRYEDTAYEAHGNYGVLYDINIPIVNNTGDAIEVIVRFDNPVKSDAKSASLKFLEPPSTLVFFRGTVLSSIKWNSRIIRSKNSHLVLHKGEKGPNLSAFILNNGQSANVLLKLVYPADSTPPQVLSIVSSPCDK